MNKLNLIEQECEDVLLEVRDWLAVAIFTKSRRQEFIDLMGSIREALDHLNNKKFGCSTGIHSGDCFCEKEKYGKSLGYFKQLKDGGKNENL